MSYIQKFQIWSVQFNSFLVYSELCNPHHNLTLEHLCWPQKKHPLVVTLHSLLSLGQGSHKSLYRFAYSGQCRYMETFNMWYFVIGLSLANCFQGLSMVACIRIPFIYTLHFVYSFVWWTLQLFPLHTNVHSQWQMYEGCNFSTSSNAIFNRK